MSFFLVLRALGDSIGGTVGRRTVRSVGRPSRADVPSIRPCHVDTYVSMMGGGCNALAEDEMEGVADGPASAGDAAGGGDGRHDAAVSDARYHAEENATSCRSGRSGIRPWMAGNVSLWGGRDVEGPAGDGGSDRRWTAN